MPSQTTMKTSLAEIRTDIKWMKDGIEKMLAKQDITNGRINTLENRSDNFVTRTDCNKTKEGYLKKQIDTKDKVKWYLVGGSITFLFSVLMMFLKSVV